jgi:hypothetical protein
VVHANPVELLFNMSLDSVSYAGGNAPLIGDGEGYILAPQSLSFIPLSVDFQTGPNLMYTVGRTYFDSTFASGGFIVVTQLGTNSVLFAGTFGDIVRFIQDDHFVGGSGGIGNGFVGASLANTLGIGYGPYPTSVMFFGCVFDTYCADSSFSQTGFSESPGSPFGGEIGMYVRIEAVSTPEPATLALLAPVLFGSVAFRRRYRRATPRIRS